MKRLALAAAAALGLSTAFVPTAFAETWYECFDRIQDDCALFVPRGSANWAACVESLAAIECGPPPGASMQTLGEDVLGKLN